MQISTPFGDDVTRTVESPAVVPCQCGTGLAAAILLSRLALTASERVRDPEDQPQATLPFVSQMRAQKVQVRTARPVGVKQILDAPAQHPGKRTIGRRHIRHVYLRDLLIQVRHSKLSLAKRVELVSVCLSVCLSRVRPNGCFRPGKHARINGLAGAASTG